jgi:two-component system CheB/CheR fusion protein
MESTESLRLFLKSTTDYAVIQISLDGVIETWAGAAERVLGYTAQEAIGLSLSEFFTEEDRSRGLDAHEISVARERGRSEDDRWHLRKDGSKFWASGVLTLVRSEDGSPMGLCKVLRDKSDVRTQFELLENLVTLARRDLETERNVVRSLAHELRNPLMPIVSSLELLRRADAGSDVHEMATRVLTNQVGVLKRLVDDLSEVDAVAESGLCLNISPVNLSAALREVLASLQALTSAKARKLSLLLPATDIWVDADSERLQQMLLNLLNNALKYTSEGGHVDVTASVEADMAVVRVDDDGVGISTEMLPKIFELFTREVHQRHIEGAGIGLAVVKQLATAQGGFVEARSPGHDKGASFSLRIPVKGRGVSQPSNCST